LGAADHHAGHFLKARTEQIAELRRHMNVPPLVLSPFDAELFGHWWFEGPEWLNAFLRKAAYDQTEFQLTTPSRYLAEHPTHQMLAPAASSWGHKGYWEVWLEESNAWVYPHLHTAHAWLRRHAPSPGPVSLSWGDAKLGNCVFDAQGRVAAALDWEQACLAHPVDDLAWWLMLDGCLSEGYGVPRLPGLPSRDETVAHWERASGLPADDLGYHEVFAAWRMAVIMARIGTLFTQRGWVEAPAQMDVRNGAATLLAGHAQRLGF
jgi:hypothetical protein